MDLELAILLLPPGLVIGLLVRELLRRRPRTAGGAARVEGRSRETLELLRRIDKMILSNLSLPYVAQEIVDLLPGRGELLGGTLRTIEPRHGHLQVLAVSDGLCQVGRNFGLHALEDYVESPESFSRGEGLVAQAINQRRIVWSGRVAAADAPPLEPAVADRAQRELGIQAVFVFPVIVEERVHGALTFYLAKPADHLGAKEREVMQLITNEVGIAMENARLLSQLEDINRQLERANGELKKTDAAKDEFISIASHQLRSPLTAVKGYLSMLIDGDYGPISKRHVQVLTQVEQSANEVIGLINDMLTIARISAGKFDLQTTPIDPAQLVQEVCAELKPLARQKGLRFTCQLPAKPIGTVNVDVLKLRQVIVNFIDNAIKYTARGTVTVKLAADARDLVFTVNDSGIGIPAGELDRMFHKYYRASNARQMVTVGTGLGLYVAEQIIEGHNGEAIVESTEGEGSTFGFRIPLATITTPKLAGPLPRPPVTSPATR